MSNDRFSVEGVTFHTMCDVQLSAQISPTMKVVGNFPLHVTEVDDLAFMSKVFASVDSLSLPDVKTSLRTPNDCLVFFVSQLKPILEKMARLPVSRVLGLQVLIKENMSLTRRIVIRKDGLPSHLVEGMLDGESLQHAWHKHTSDMNVASCL